MKRVFYQLSNKSVLVIVLTLISASMFLSCNKNNDKITPEEPKILQFVYTSDSHFGITRKAFRGAADVDSKIVNTAMVTQINALSQATLPSDNGVNAGARVGGIDFVVSTGDMANRAEDGCLPAIESWNQFTTVYRDGLNVKTEEGTKAELFISPGNHDISNAIGHPKIKSEKIDATVMANIYNYVYKPAVAKTGATYNYYTDKIQYSKSVKGVHFVFLNIWPDASSRAWIANDIKNVSGPVVLLTHDQPDIESKHLMDSRSDAAVNNYVFTSKFENLVTDKASEGATTSVSSETQQREFTSFIASNKKIKAYFHGNSNWNEFYTYTGIPSGTISLPVFRVDSPMKGDFSADDETKLSFQLVTINLDNMHMTVRECLWNTTASSTAPIVWGNTKSISLR